MTGASVDKRATVRADLTKLRLRGLGELTDTELRERFPFLLAIARESQPEADDVSDSFCLARALIAAQRGIRRTDIAEAAALLFGLTRESRGRSHAYRRSLARRAFDPEPSESTFRQRPQYLSAILDELSDQLVLRHTRPHRGESLRPSARPRHVTRGIEEEAWNALRAEARPQVLWGESGNGKTYLAQELLRRWQAQGGQAAFVRCWDHEVKAEFYSMDLITLAELFDIPARTLSLAGLEATIREIIQSEPGLLVVLDDASGNLLERILPDSPAARILITSRVYLDESLSYSVIQPYAEEEVATIAERAFGATSPEIAQAMVRAVGCRPIAVDVVARMVDSGRFDAEHLLEVVLEDSVVALGSLASLAGFDLTLMRVYEAVLGELSEYELSVVTALVWLAGELSSVEFCTEVRHAAGASPLESVQLLAALEELAQRGVITVTDPSRQEFSINTLTRDYLRFLTRAQATEAACRLVEALLEEQHSYQAADAPEWSHGVLRHEFQILRRHVLAAFPGAQCGALCVDENTWIAWQRGVDFVASADGTLQVLLVSVIPDIGIFLAGDHSDRAELAPRQAQSLLFMAGIYRTVIASSYLQSPGLAYSRGTYQGLLHVAATPLGVPLHRRYFGCLLTNCGVVLGSEPPDDLPDDARASCPACIADETERQARWELRGNTIQLGMRIGYVRWRREWLSYLLSDFRDAPIVNVAIEEVLDMWDPEDPTATAVLFELLLAGVGHGHPVDQLPRAISVLNEGAGGGPAAARFVAAVAGRLEGELVDAVTTAFEELPEALRTEWAEFAQDLILNPPMV